MIVRFSASALFATMTLGDAKTLTTHEKPIIVQKKRGVARIIVTTGSTLAEAWARRTAPGAMRQVADVPPFGLRAERQGSAGAQGAALQPKERIT